MELEKLTEEEIKILSFESHDIKIIDKIKLINDFAGKILDDIPKGMELKGTNIIEINAIKVLFKPIEPVKDFVLYKRKYLKSIYDSGNASNPLGWDFEYKLGLLNFICKDFGVNVFEFIEAYKIGSSMEKLIKIKDICPPDFLNSIINE